MRLSCIRFSVIESRLLTVRSSARILKKRQKEIAYLKSCGFFHTLAIIIITTTINITIIIITMNSKNIFTCIKVRSIVMHERLQINQQLSMFFKKKKYTSISKWMTHDRAKLNRSYILGR